MRRCPDGEGLALGLGECYRETMLSPQEDAYGQSIYKHFRGGRAAEVVERDDGYVQSSIALPAAYFDGFKNWPSHQRQAIRFVRGRVLDIGCGAGRVGLHLKAAVMTLFLSIGPHWQSRCADFEGSRMQRFCGSLR